MYSVACTRDDGCVFHCDAFPRSICPHGFRAEDFVDQAQQSVALIWDMVAKAREWVANVADVLNPGLDPRKVNGDSAASIAVLQRLLSEANSLNVSVAEADEVARIIHAAVEWQRKVDEILTALQAPVRGRAGRSNCVQLSTLRSVLDEAELIPVHLDQRLQLQERVQSEMWIWFDTRSLMHILCFAESRCKVASVTALSS